MRYLSVCSGIEAATVAWHPLGWEPAAFSDIEAFPRAVLRHHYPHVPLHGSERARGESLADYAGRAGFQTIQGDEYGSIDLLVGGTPCQSFSIAGLRGGLADERGNLALEYLRLARRARARWLVWENVPGVLSSGGGRDFGAILGGMAELGYGFAYAIRDAQFFGVPQRRRRVFVVGYLGDWRRAAAVLFERHGLQGNPPPRREARQGAAGFTTGSFGQYRERCGSLRAQGGDFSGGSETLIAQGFGGGNSEAIDVATTLTTKNQRIDFEAETFIAHSLRAEGFDASEDGTGRGTPLVPVHAFDARQSDVIQYGDISGPLDTDGYGVAVAFSAKDFGGDALEDCSPTLRAGGHSGSHANSGAMPAVAFAMRGRDGGALPELEGEQTGALRAANGGSSRSYIAAQAVRRLTPRECERLQGFPDDYTMIPWRGRVAEECPDGPRYKALGNSMAVPVMRWIGERIAAVEAMDLDERAAA